MSHDSCVAGLGEQQLRLLPLCFSKPCLCSLAVSSCPKTKVFSHPSDSHGNLTCIPERAYMSTSNSILALVFRYLHQAEAKDMFKGTGETHLGSYGGTQPEDQCINWC